MPMQRASFPKDLEEGLNAHFGAEYREYPPEYVHIFDTYNSDKAFEEDVLEGTFGPAGIVGEGEPFPEHETRQGWVSRYVHYQIGMKFAITQIAAEDNLYMQVGAKHAKLMAKSMREAVEVLGANILNNAAENAVGGDGKTLLATDHPLLFGGTGSNTLSTPADLSESSLEDMFTMIRKATNDRGTPIALTPRRLLIPPDLIFTAARLLKSINRPGVPDNDINAIRALGIISSSDVSTITRLTDPDRWFIKTDAMDGLKFFNRIGVQTGLDEDFNTGNMLYKARRRCSFGWSDWRGCFGSVGS